jgi:hypothetical protein
MANQPEVQIIEIGPRSIPEPLEEAGKSAFVWQSSYPCEPEKHRIVVQGSDVAKSSCSHSEHPHEEQNHRRKPDISSESDSSFDLSKQLRKRDAPKECAEQFQTSAGRQLLVVEFDSKNPVDTRAKIGSS